MTDHPEQRSPKTRARSLRQNQTRSEGLLWSILRAKQLCGLKFRRQHAIGPWFVDFACVDKMLVVEVDGGYHDEIIAKDLQREEDLRKRGWNVIRFSDDDVEDDAEAVGRAIAHKLGIPFEFRRREATGSGMRSGEAVEKRNRRAHKPSPSPDPSGLDPPGGRVEKK